MIETISMLLCAYMDLLSWVLRITFAVDFAAEDGSIVTIGEVMLLTCTAGASVLLLTWWVVPLRWTLSLIAFEYRSRR